MRGVLRNVHSVSLEYWTQLDIKNKKNEICRYVIPESVFLKSTLIYYVENSQDWSWPWKACTNNQEMPKWLPNVHTISLDSRNLTTNFSWYLTDCNFVQSVQRDVSDYKLIVY